MVLVLVLALSGDTNVVVTTGSVETDHLAAWLSGRLAALTSSLQVTSRFGDEPSSHLAVLMPSRPANQPSSCLDAEPLIRLAA